MSFIRAVGMKVALLAFTTNVPCLEGQEYAELRVPASVLQRYVGEWVYPNGNSVMLNVRGETLYREIPGQQVAFVPITETLFRLGPVFTAEFVMDKAGGITQILSDGAGVEYRLHRKGSTPAQPTASVAAVRVPKSVLERYVGVYEFIPGQMSRTDLRIVVGLKGDTLTRQMSGDEVALTPISATQFRVGSTSLMVEFVVDEKGVTQILGSGFQQLRARLIPKS